jgi:hypothetical protein
LPSHKRRGSDKPFVLESGNHLLWPRLLAQSRRSCVALQGARGY